MVRRCAWGVAAALVFLRLAVGWHFFNAGLDKISYDRSSGEWKMTFSSEGFLRQAKGPLAGFFQSRLPGGHEWHTTLAVPQELTPKTGQQLSNWVTGYVKRRQDELGKGVGGDPEVPEFAPYAAWFTEIEADRRATLERLVAVEGLSEEQRAAAADVFELRQLQLSDYLAEEALAMQDYRHQLWRLEHLQEKPEAAEVPFEELRVTQKQAELARTPQKWLGVVRQFDTEFAEELAGLLTEEQRANAIANEVESAVTDPKASGLHRMNLAVTTLTLSVGLCLLVGLFTPVAAVAGALFLMTVMATQPPWVAGANTEFFYYQLVEFAALVLLAVAGAGRVAGLDFFLCRLGSKCCGGKGQ